MERRLILCLQLVAKFFPLLGCNNRFVPVNPSVLNCVVFPEIEIYWWSCLWRDERACWGANCIERIGKMVKFSISAHNKMTNFFCNALSCWPKGAVQVKLELGHRAQVRKKPTVEGFTHDWMVFVRGPEHSNIQHFVDKVVFHLHESFPKPKRGKMSCILWFLNGLFDIFSLELVLQNKPMNVNKLHHCNSWSRNQVLVADHELWWVQLVHS